MALKGSGESSVNRILGGNTSNPGNFLLRECSIMRENLGGQELGNQKLDIKNFVGELSINESIYKNAINVDIRIMDNSKLYSGLRLNGSEKIRLVIGRNADTLLELFNLDLVISDLDLFTQVSNDMQSYVLKCVPEYTLINQTKTISDSFTDIIEAVKSICHGDLKIPNIKLDRPLKREIESSALKGLIAANKKKNNPFGINLTSEQENEKLLPSQPAKGIYPLMKPLSVINWLVRNISNNSTPYYFYQTSNGIVKLRSYQDMLNNPNSFNADTAYTNVESLAYYAVEDTMKDSEKDFYEIEKFKILKLNQPSNLSTIKNISSGSYASNKHSIDIYKKEYIGDDTFEYSGMKTLNPSKPFSDSVKFGEKKLLDNKTSRNYFVNLNSGAFDDNNLGNYHSIINDTIQKKEAYFNIIDSQIQEIVINGDFLVESGQTINLEILQNLSADKKLKDEEIDTPDKMLSGTYLVTALQHSFENQKFTTRLRVKRDSYDLDMNEPEKVFKENTFTKDG